MPDRSPTLAAISGHVDRAERAARPTWTASTHGLALGAVVLGAALLRFWSLDTIPPGLHHDEAINGFNALRVLNGERPIFFEAGGGREPLFMYLAAGSVALLGTTPLALRAMAALIGTLTVPASYLLARRLLGPRVGLLTAALVGSSYWHLHTSRLGLRAITLPLALCLVGYFLWGGLRAGRRRDFLLAGALLGLAGYTYFASRLFPLALLGFVLLAALLDRSFLRRQLAGLLLVAATAALVAAPLLLWSLTHGAEAGQRIGEASVFSQPDPAGALRDGVTGALGMFLIRGDFAWRYNYDSRPIFDPVVGALFVAGLGLALWRLREKEHLFILAWVATMTLPTALATESPNAIRALGIVPALYVLPALALDGAAALLARVVGQVSTGEGQNSAKPDVWTAVLVPLVAVALFAWQGAGAARTYFQEWAPDPRTYRVFHTSSVAATELLRTIPPNETVYLSEDSYEPAELVPGFLLASATPVPRPGPERLPFRWFDGTRELVLPPEPAGAVWFVFPSAALPPAPQRDALFPGAERRTGPPGPDGPAFVAFRTAPEQRSAVRPRCPVGVSFGGIATLLGYDPADPAPSGASGMVTLYWRIDRPLAGRLAMFLHVLDRSGEGWGGRDEPGYFSAQRLAGETIVAWHRFPVVPGTPPGSYALAVGLYRPDGARLEPQGAPAPIADPRCGSPAVPLGSNALAAGVLEVTPGQPEAPRPGQEAGGLVLVQGMLDRAEARPGESLGATLLWQSRRDEPGTLRVRPRLLAGDGSLLGEWPAEPVGGSHESGRWRAGELVRQRLRLVFPPLMPPGVGRLVLELVDEAGRSAGELSLGELRVVELPRQFDPPPIAHPLRARFGDQVELLGYDLAGAWQPGGKLRLTLYWRALSTMSTSYKVFTHLLDEGSRIRGQHDGVPVDGRRPTSGWLPGEVLVDEHLLELAADAPPGRYRLEIGLYEPTSGARLAVLDGDGRPSADHLIVAKGEVR